MKMPVQKPYGSKQDYGTPREFLDAVTRRFGEIDVDLAADDENTVATSYFNEAENALTQPWPREGLLWLNPPFSRIAPWAKKAAESGSRVLLLVPASIGSEWFATWVWPYATVLALRPRLTFDGCSAPYPKDLILAWYGGAPRVLDLWRWK